MVSVCLDCAGGRCGRKNNERRGTTDAPRRPKRNYFEHSAEIILIDSTCRRCSPPIEDDEPVVLLVVLPVVPVLPEPEPEPSRRPVTSIL